WLRQPVVLGYVLAGLVVGPHVPVPLVADRAIVQTLSELGVILLMFSLGLELRFGRLAKLAPTAGLTALIECSAMFWLGGAVGEWLGWSPRESLFAGALVAISSTTVIVKAFDELHASPRLRERVVSVLIVEDVIAILLLALLPAMAQGEEVGWGELGLSVARFAMLLALMLALGALLVPRAIRAVLRLGRAETTLVASLGICFAFAVGAHALGYSVALGAFLAGSLVGESGGEDSVAKLVHPVRDLFAAIFFVSVGMLIDPRLLWAHWPAVLALALTVVAGKTLFASTGAFLAGGGVRRSLETGMSLAQIGEFSFILASIGVASGAAREFLHPVAVAVSALTMLTTPWMIRAAPRAAAQLDRKLPRRVQTFAALYGSWLEKLRSGESARTTAARLRRLAGLIALDALALAALVVSLSIFGSALQARLAELLGVSAGLARAIVLAGSLAIAAPLALGLMRVARRIGVTLASAALPDARSGQLDLSIAPRRALGVTLQLATVLLVALPLLALLQPFLSPAASGLGLALVIGALVVTFWRSTADLQGHVRAGATAILEALASQARGRPSGGALALDRVGQLLPGLGEPEAIALSANSAAVGRTLSALDLRGLTGATVLAITRGEREIVLPGAGEVLAAGDLLALAGTHEAVAAAKELLEAPARP
ncbi:MAG TPA: cation:proton antiporter, partial [Myxococcota bacterium]|nr:cation:proton antiporter [Myxococcota bacterium]